MNEVLLRKGEPGDLEVLFAIEKRCFDTDRLSKRSFRHFLKPGSHDLIVLQEDNNLVGYVLTLFRSGTNLARMYSIAVAPELQGKGYAHRLIKAAEVSAAEKYCVFIRLEVNVANTVARQLYEKHDYHVIERLDEYYEDGSDAFRMEKRLHALATDTSKPKPFYEQTTDFTCGPAALMMAIKTLQPDYLMTVHEELQIWREATTIFMTSGHGGCSPHGLALSAWHRGLNATLHINLDGAPFLDSVRDEKKKAVIQLVHQDFLEQIAKTDVTVHTHNLSASELDAILDSGNPVLALISTWHLNRNKAPHWVYVAASDEEFVYINDPDLDNDPYYSQTDFIQIPIRKKIFRDMARFGQKNYVHYW